MAVKLYDRVKDTSTTTGTGTFTLANSAPTGYRTFGSVLSNNETTVYCIEHQLSNEWEVGVGTYSSNTLTRDSVISSSNSNSVVSFTSGTKNVFITVTADMLSSKSDTYNNLSNYSCPVAGVNYHVTDSPYSKMVSNGTLASSITGSSQVGNVYSYLWDHYLPLAGKITTIPIISSQLGILDGAINNSVTSLTSSTSSFPTGVTQTVPFMIKIDSEVLLVTAKSGTTFTVTRGYDGTTAASHLDDAPITFLSWRWCNQSNATVSTTYGGLNIANEVSNGGSTAYNVLVRPLPGNASGNYTITGAFIPRWTEVNYGIVSIGLRESSSGKLRTNDIFRYDGSTSAYWYRRHMTNATTQFNASVITNIGTLLNGPIFYFKFTDDTTNSKMFLSIDNRNWSQLFTEPRTSFCTPDQFVIGTNPYSNSASIHLVAYNDAQ